MCTEQQKKKFRYRYTRVFVESPYGRADFTARFVTNSRLHGEPRCALAWRRQANDCTFRAEKLMGCSSAQQTVATAQQKAPYCKGFAASRALPYGEHLRGAPADDGCACAHDSKNTGIMSLGNFASRRYVGTFLRSPALQVRAVPAGIHGRRSVTRRVFHPARRSAQVAGLNPVSTTSEQDVQDVKVRAAYPRRQAASALPLAPAPVHGFRGRRSHPVVGIR